MQVLLCQNQICRKETKMLAYKEDILILKSNHRINVL